MNTQALEALDKICPMDSSEAQDYFDKTGVPPHGWKLIRNEEFNRGTIAFHKRSDAAYGDAEHFLVRNDWKS